MSNKIEVYTDGACSGNPGAGAWAVVIETANGRKAIVGNEAKTTNNRMEVLAAVNALRELDENTEAVVYADSNYVVEFINNYGEKQAAKGWHKADGSVCANVELISELWRLHRNHKKVQFVHVGGHGTCEGNNTADRIAVWARDLAKSGKIFARLEKTK